MLVWVDYLIKFDSKDCKEIFGIQRCNLFLTIRRLVHNTLMDRTERPIQPLILIFEVLAHRHMLMNVLLGHRHRTRTVDLDLLLWWRLIITNILLLSGWICFNHLA